MDHQERLAACAEAIELAHAIEAVLARAGERSAGSSVYGLRLSEAMTRSLIDQLRELCES